ncbi:hypothetical protein GGF50DRAFT_119600 [Schizophyllum commune]
MSVATRRGGLGTAGRRAPPPEWKDPIAPQPLHTLTRPPRLGFVVLPERRWPTPHAAFERSIHERRAFDDGQEAPAVLHRHARARGAVPVGVPAPPNSQEPAPKRSGALRPKVPAPRRLPGLPRLSKTRTAYASAPLPLHRSDRRRLANPQSPAPLRRSGDRPRPRASPWRLDGDDDDDASLIHDRALDEVSNIGTASSTSSTSSLGGALPELQLGDEDSPLAAIFRGYDSSPMPLIPGLAPGSAPRRPSRVAPLTRPRSGVRQWHHGFRQPSPEEPTLDARLYKLPWTVDFEPTDLCKRYAYAITREPRPELRLEVADERREDDPELETRSPGWYLAKEGYAFITNTIPLHALALILMGHYSSRLCVGYSSCCRSWNQGNSSGPVLVVS